MGREVTGVRVEAKSTCTKVNPNGITTDTDPKKPEGNSNAKHSIVKECIAEVSHGENSHEKVKILQIKSTNLKAEKSASGSTHVGNVRTKYAATNPSDLDTDKRACVRLIAVESVVASPKSSDVKSPSSDKKSQPNSPLLSKKNLDDDDNWSVISSTAARSRTTVPVAPTFSISERLEKRREYYAKLEEKRQALEAERREHEARTKEEQEAAVKQLRKSLVFKANPVPSFYYDKSPHKKEPKTLSTTRAISPKLGRRKSCSDTPHSSSDEKAISNRANLHSIDIHKEGLTPAGKSEKKDQTSSQIGNINPNDKVRNGTKLANEQNNANISIES